MASSEPEDAGAAGAACVNYKLQWRIDSVGDSEIRSIASQVDNQAKLCNVTGFGEIVDNCMAGIFEGEFTAIHYLMHWIKNFKGFLVSHTKMEQIISVSYDTFIFLDAPSVDQIDE